MAKSPVTPVNPDQNTGQDPDQHTGQNLDQTTGQNRDQNTSQNRDQHTGQNRDQSRDHSTGQNTGQNKGNWSETKDKLKQKFPALVDSDLRYDKGKKDEMLVKVQEKLGKTKEELDTIIADL